jgi:hypothetical protein
VDGAKVVGKRAQLRPVFHVAREQDVARGIGVAEEVSLIVGQLRTGKAEDRRCH